MRRTYDERLTVRHLFAFLIVLAVILTVSATTRVYKDGTFSGFSQGDRYGYVKVEVTVKNDKIENVKIWEYDGLGIEKLPETYGKRFPTLFEMHKEMVKRIVSKNTWDVDVYTGATISSNKVREAVKFALERAKAQESKHKYFDGTFMGTSNVTARGYGIAWVTIKDDKIINVVLEETRPKTQDGKTVLDEAGRPVFELKPADYQWQAYHEAKREMPKRFIEKQSTKVDVYTGATSSSRNWIQAVEKALEAASTK
ncbi:FMN-binding protein [Fervidobacterium thailandense]|nr:FMN-binding protein [Fervidobacterium thailandense]